MAIKFSKSKELERTAERLAEVIEARRKIEREERTLKDTFKDILEGVTALQVGDFVVTAVPKTRSVLDRTALVMAFGESNVAECEKVVTYTEVNVTRHTPLDAGNDVLEKAQVSR